MEKEQGQQVYDDGAIKNWAVEFRGKWIDYIGRTWSGEIAAWAVTASNDELEKMANTLIALRFAQP